MVVAIDAVVAVVVVAMAVAIVAVVAAPAFVAAVWYDFSFHIVVLLSGNFWLTVVKQY